MTSSARRRQARVERDEPLVKGVDDMVLGIRGIEASSVYQSILEKGRAAGIAKAEAEAIAAGIAKGLLRVGRIWLGAPREPVEAAIMAISDRERLLRLIDRLQEVATWEELLATEAPCGPIERGGSDRPEGDGDLR